MSKTKPGANPGVNIPRSRPPLERIMRIHKALSAGEYPNGTTLAREFEVSTKSIQRDIEFMRERLELPIEFNSARNGFYYAKEVKAFPALQVSEGEIFALIVAEKALHQFRGTSFEKPLVNALKKIAVSLPETVSFNMADWEQAISFRTSAEPLAPLGIFETVTRAAAELKQLEITYRKPGQAKPDTRVIDPYHLANINGEWFLFAFDHLRADLRTFVPARILSARRTGKSFERPEKFSVDKTLRDSFGVHSGRENFQVIVQFDTFASDYIREKRWHHSQELLELQGGGVELRLRLSSLIEIERWLLGWGPHVRVLQPPELVASIRNAAAAILAGIDSTRPYSTPLQNRLK